jgi:hypothetical protein
LGCDRCPSVTAKEPLCLEEFVLFDGDTELGDAPARRMSASTSASPCVSPL